MVTGKIDVRDVSVEDFDFVELDTVDEIIKPDEEMVKEELNLEEMGTG